MTIMSQSRALVAFLLALGAGCAAVPEEAPSVVVQADSVGTGTGQVSGVDADDLELWRDADFKRRFTESYLAETEIEPRVTADERDKMTEVLELISNEQIDKAVALIRKSRNEASSAVFDFTLANVFFQQERLDEAAVAYEAAVEKFAKFRRAWRNLGLVRVRQGDFVNSCLAFTRVIELGGGDAVTYGLLGYSYANVGNDVAAESAYRMANLLDPGTMDWKMGLARSFFQQGRFADAVALCKSLIEAEPDRSDLWLLQANAYIGLGQPMRAAENFELVDRLGASTVDSLTMLGDIYVNEEHFDLAVDAYVRATETDTPPTYDRLVRAAKVLTARGAHDAASTLIARIETVYGSEQSPEARKDLLKLQARLAVALGAGDDEARVLEEIVALDPLDGEALILLGQHAARSGDPEKAIFYYERAASLEAFEADAKVRHAQLLVGRGNYADALPLLRRAQTIQPRENVQQYLDQVERVARGR